VASGTQTALYERLFLLNCCLQHAAEIVQQFEQEGVIHPVYASERKRALEDLRSDLSHVLTGMLHHRELEACVGLAREKIAKEPKEAADFGGPE
jgi:hypothetical protein